MKQNPGLLLRCGCEIPFIDGKLPVCPEHGNQSVVRVLRMPAPRIVGTAKGPHVTTKDLPPFVGRITGTETVH